MKIIGINVAISDPLERVQKFVKMKKASFTIVLDHNQSVAERYQLYGTSWSVLIDSDGNISSIARGVPQNEVVALLKKAS